MKIVNRKIKDLIGAEYNPRELTKDQYKQLKDSLLRFGVVDPVIVNKHPDRDNIIIGGHQRSKVWGDMGNDKIPTVELSLTLDKEKELNVRLNKNTGQFDMDMLANNFDTEDLIEWGFSEGELVGFDVDLEAEEDEFDVPDGGIETDIVAGDLFEIGEHRLLCGDSTDSDTVAKLMNGEKADMVFTDPPYGVDYKGQIESMNYNGNKGKKRDIILNDKNTNSIIDFMPLMKEFCSGVAYVFCGAGKELDLLQSIKDNKYEMINTLIWNKPKGTLALGANYKPCFELFYYIKIQGDRNWSGNNAEWTVWDIEYKKDNTLHPTQKPIKLIEKALKNHNDKSILDFFLGSGSTMVASHQLKRKCYGMELDPKYCQVIVDRMLKLDENLVVKLNGKPYEKELVSL